MMHYPDTPALPRLMVAPTGARRTKADHPALPVSIAEIVEAAAACHAVGADGLHAHVRDREGRHVLDAGLYRELLAEMQRAVPAMAVQITTEAAGRHTPDEQRALVAALGPRRVSVALREMTADNDPEAERRFYHDTAEAGIGLQHILYEAGELHQLAALIARGIVPDMRPQLLFVMGRYTEGGASGPEALIPFSDALGALPGGADWGACAFGQAETSCLVATAQAGGKLRVGFENSLQNADGSLARDNAERVREVLNAVTDGQT